jgi:ribosomal protein S27AE
MLLAQECIDCKKIKTLDEFYFHPQMHNRHLGKCKECCKCSTKINYRNNINHYVEYDKHREQTEKRKAQKLKHQRTRRFLYPEKYKANSSVNNLIRNSQLKKKPCEICGNRTTEAHHNDYSKPLEIVWVCKRCHNGLHGKETRTF